MRGKKKASLVDIDIMQRPVNGCTINSKGQIVTVHLYGSYYLDVESKTLRNQYQVGERQVSAEAVADAVKRARLWRKCWECMDTCSTE